MQTSFLAISISLFLVLNATGQIPFFLALFARFDHKRQIQIITRELLIALAILLLFIFCGDQVLHLLGISRPIIGVAGGILLFLISLTMVFPRKITAFATFVRQGDQPSFRLQSKKFTQNSSRIPSRTTTRINSCSKRKIYLFANLPMLPLLK